MEVISEAVSTGDTVLRRLWTNPLGSRLTCYLGHGIERAVDLNILSMLLVAHGRLSLSQLGIFLLDSHTHLHDVCVLDLRWLSHVIENTGALQRWSHVLNHDHLRRRWIMLQK